MIYRKNKIIIFWSIFQKMIILKEIQEFLKRMLEDEVRAFDRRLWKNKYSRNNNKNDLWKKKNGNFTYIILYIELNKKRRKIKS